MKTIWFDVTEIAEWQGHLTGIQRVIYNIGSELSRKQGKGLRFCRFDSTQRIMYETMYDFQEYGYVDTAEVSKKTPMSSTSSPQLTRVIGKFKPYVPVFIKHQARKSLNKFRNSKSPTNQTKTIDISDGDILFIPGAFFVGYIDEVQKLRKICDLKIVGVMYDLAPIIVPQFSDAGLVQAYRQELSKAINFFDQWISISQNSKQDLLDFALKAEQPIKPQNVQVIRLGDVLDRNGSSQKPYQLKDRRDFILMVSTIEARKNQALIYQTVKRAIELSIELPLIVLVGKHGWLSDDLVYMLKSDPTIKDHITWLEKVDDKGLRWLYQNCLFTLYPSYYEGWGLPVAESLANGKYCLASNTSSIPEIAGNLIQYFSPYSSDELLKLLQMYSDKTNLKSATEKISHFKTTTWDETGMQVAKIIAAL